MQYKYKAIDTSGNRTEGFVEAVTDREAIAMLAGTGIYVVEIKKVNNLALTGGFRKRVKKNRLSAFYRLLAFLLKAGIGVYRALCIMRDYEDDKNIKKLLSDLAIDIENGSSLSAAMGKHKKVFSESEIYQVLAGEEGGSLEEILLRLADQLETNDRIISKIRSAMIYPSFVAVTAIVVVLFMTGYIVPNIASVLISLGGQLPLITELVISFSNFVKSYYIFIIMLIILTPIAVKLSLKNDKIKYLFDEYVVKVPVIGKMIYNSELVLFTRTLSSLLKCGLPIVRSLSVTQDVISNKYMNSRLGIVRNKIELDGKSLSESLMEDKYFPGLLVQLVEVGSTSGSLYEMLDNYADRVEEVLDNNVRTLISLIEPAMILILGGVVGVIVIAMYLPMVSLINQI